MQSLPAGLLMTRPAHFSNMAQSSRFASMQAIPETKGIGNWLLLPRDIQSYSHTSFGGRYASLIGAGNW